MVRKIVFFILVMEFMHASDRLPNPSIRQTQQLKTIDLFAKALYWYTSEVFDWAFTLNSTATTVDSSYKTFVFNWAPGFSVGMGYNLMHDEWDMKLSYTRFQSKASDRTHGTVKSGFLPARLSKDEPFSFGSAKLHIHYNMFDWDLGQSYLISKHFSIHPLFGIKGGWIKQILRSHWRNANTTAKENLLQRFTGGGPKGGASSKFTFGSLQKSTFSLTTQFDTGYLWGHWNIQDKYKNNLEKVVTLNTTDRDFGSLVLHTFFGFGWETNFNCDRSHVALNIGYEIEDWFNQAQFFTNISGSMSSDLILQGLNFSMAFDF